MKRMREAAINSGYSSHSVQHQAQTRKPGKMGRVLKPDDDRGSVSSPIHVGGCMSGQNTIGDLRHGKQIIKLIGLSASLSEKPCRLLKLPDDILISVIKFIVTQETSDMNTFMAIQTTCKRMKSVSNSVAVWGRIPMCHLDGSMNMDALIVLKKKSQGTEGSCFQARYRGSQRFVALKRARVYPDNEGVPYYMMRELSALKTLNHPNICNLERVTLNNYKLRLIFSYVEQTLHDFVNPGGGDKTVAVKPSQVRGIMSQLLSAVCHCHERGIMHRNLKPKHLLIIPGDNLEEPLEGCTVKVADFALVRVLVNPPRQYTTEVITLWYRPPEILMGQRSYTTAVDIWSVGCIFAELLQGKPLFTGLCEIDQLFQIFSKLGTPNPDMWPDFKTLPYFQDTIFPRWSSV